MWGIGKCWQTNTLNLFWGSRLVVQYNTVAYVIHIFPVLESQSRSCLQLLWICKEHFENGKWKWERMEVTYSHNTVITMKTLHCEGNNVPRFDDLLVCSVFRNLKPDNQTVRMTGGSRNWPLTYLKSVGSMKTKSDQRLPSGYIPVV